MDKRFPNAKSDYYETPNMNKILNRGIRFSNGYASSPVCSPTGIVFNLERTCIIGPNERSWSPIALIMIKLA